MGFKVTQCGKMFTIQFTIVSLNSNHSFVYISRVGSKPMETPGVCEIELPNRRIVSGSESPTDLDSPCQVHDNVTILMCWLCSGLIS